MVIWIVLMSVALACLGEWWHARRCRRIAYLAFGPQGAPRPWTRLTAPVRVACLALAVWGLMELYLRNPADPGAQHDRRPALQHLVLCFDVSPSMQIADAGPRSDLRRAERASQVLRGLLTRVDMRRTRVTAIPFYSSARPVVIDAVDPEVIANILDDLPLEHLFSRGKTNLFATLEGANSVAQAWSRDSATLVVVSDGDTLPRGQTPELSEAFRQALVLGVGDADRGTPIDGHDSRQDSASLRDLAARVRGRYADANVRHPTPQLIAGLAQLPGAEDENQGPERRTWAALALLVGSAGLALLGPALALAGTSWRPRLATVHLKPQTA
jgi:Ca-activated chloride channel family protein